MIFILAILIVIGIVETLILRQKNVYHFNMVFSKKLNNRIEILKSFSFLPSSKNKNLKEDLDRTAFSFFAQDKFPSFSVIVLKKKFGVLAQVFRYSSVYATSIEDSQLTALEKFLIEKSKNDKMSPINVYPIPEQTEEKKLELVDQEPRWKSAIILPLHYQDKESGKIIFFRENQDALESEEVYFLTSISNIISLLIRKYELIISLGQSEQVEAVNIQW